MNKRSVRHATRAGFRTLGFNLGSGLYLARLEDVVEDRHRLVLVVAYVVCTRVGLTGSGGKLQGARRIGARGFCQCRCGS